MNVDLPPRYISLFTGCGGLDLAIGLAIPAARCVCRVENDAAVTRILAARMEEGSLEPSPVWSDVRTFDGGRWRGRVDGIVGGFPCTDLSVAGKQAGIDGEHSGLWWEFARIIRDVQPGWVFIENVPPVLALDAGRAVLGELHALGFDAEWLSLRASDVGAGHQRKRVFILAYRNFGPCNLPWAEESRRLGIARNGSSVADSQRGGFRERGDGSNAELEDSARQRECDIGRGRWGVCETGSPVEHASGSERWPHAERGGCQEPGSDEQGQAASGSGERSAELGDTTSSRCSSGESFESGPVRNGARRQELDGRCDQVGDSSGTGLEERGCERRDAGEERAASERAGDSLAHADGERKSGLPFGTQPEYSSAGIGGVFAFGPSDPRWPGLIERYPFLAPATQPGIRLLADGMAFLVDASRTDQLRAAGNGVVAIQGAAALIELIRRVRGTTGKP